MNASYSIFFKAVGTRHIFQALLLLWRFLAILNMLDMLRIALACHLGMARNILTCLGIVRHGPEYIDMLGYG